MAVSPDSLQTIPKTVPNSSDAPGASVPRRDPSTMKATMRCMGNTGKLNVMRALGRVVYTTAVIRGKECRVRCWLP